MADEETESFKSESKSTSSLMNDIIFEDLKNINVMIRDSTKNFSKQAILPLWKAVDSWEEEVKPYIIWKYNQNKIDEINKRLTEVFDKLLKNWSVENYLECVDLIVEKKGIIIEAIFPSLSQSSFLFKVD